QPYTPRGKKRVTYADVVTGSGSDDSRPTSPSPEEKWNIQQTSKKCSTNKKPQQQTTKKSKFTPEKTISTVMTGYTPVDKANVHKIVIYDIPSTMPQLDILTNLGKWGQVIAFKVKTQKKYSTVTVSIDFNKWALTNWNNGVWTAPFGGMPVRWFPASWTLKQRKERERFQAVVMDIPKSITNNVVYNAENPTQSMLSQLDGALAFKIIQDRGRRKLIT
ncbi:hypothetical protein RhiirA4_451045, partial [Rhizophagus irregularis]